MPGRDDADAASQSPRPSPSTAAAAERERLARKAQLAEWRRRRDEELERQRHLREQPPPPLRPMKPPFSVSNAMPAQTEEEKRRMLQIRREQMRSPVRPGDKSITKPSQERATTPTREKHKPRVPTVKELQLAEASQARGRTGSRQREGQTSNQRTESSQQLEEASSLDSEDSSANDSTKTESTANVEDSPRELHAQDEAKAVAPVDDANELQPSPELSPAKSPAITSTSDSLPPTPVQLPTATSSGPVTLLRSPPILVIDKKPQTGPPRQVRFLGNHAEQGTPRFGFDVAATQLLEDFSLSASSEEGHRARLADSQSSTTSVITRGQRVIDEAEQLILQHQVTREVSSTVMASKREDEEPHEAFKIVEAQNVSSQDHLLAPVPVGTVDHVEAKLLEVHDHAAGDTTMSTDLVDERKDHAQPIDESAISVSTQTPVPEEETAVPSSRPRRPKFSYRRVMAYLFITLAVVAGALFIPWHSVSNRLDVLVPAASITLASSSERIKVCVYSASNATTTIFSEASAELRRDLIASACGLWRWLTLEFTQAATKVGLWVMAPFRAPLATVDEAARTRLEVLGDAQHQLQLKVEDAVRRQESWALEELEKMKQRRVTYTAAAKTILWETRKVMQEVAVEAKLSAIGQIHEFTSKLTKEVMASIQPELEAYEHTLAKEAKTEELHHAELEKIRTQESSRIEVLRVELAEKDIEAVLEGEFSADKEGLSTEKVFAEVDVMKVVEDTQKQLEDAALRVAEEMAASLVSTIHDIEDILDESESLLDTAASEGQAVFDGAEVQVDDKLTADVTQREAELTRQHDTSTAEIDSVTQRALDKLERERRAAESLAVAAARAKEAVLKEAAEAKRLVDSQLESSKKELEQELVSSAEAAAKLEKEKTTRLKEVEEQIKDAMESQVVAEVEQLIDDVGSVEGGVADVVSRVESILPCAVSSVAESLDEVVDEEAARLELERRKSLEALQAIAKSAEKEIAGTVEIEVPLYNIQPSLVANSTLVSSPENETRWVPTTLAVLFVILALLSAFALYPRWRRLISNPRKQSQSPVSRHYRRRRRRSWQQADDQSDSEPEEVTLLQTGSSTDDEAFEPEPEVVELLRSPEGETSVQSTRSVFSSSDFTTLTRRLTTTDAGASGDDEEEEFASPAPSRRALRRRTPRS